MRIDHQVLLQDYRCWLLFSFHRFGCCEYFSEFNLSWPSECWRSIFIFSDQVRNLFKMHCRRTLKNPFKLELKKLPSIFSLIYDEHVLLYKLTGMTICLIFAVMNLATNGLILILFIAICMQFQAFYNQFRLKIRNESKNDTYHFLRSLIQFHIESKR